MGLMQLTKQNIKTMKQVININFQGRVVPIEVTAFDLLKAYTESLNRHFTNEEGKEEIINDIESRIGELFQERLNNGATCITDDDVNAVIKSMGRPEDFETTDETTANPRSGSTEQGAYQSGGQTTMHKRLFRDEENKVLGGVCAGVANYFGIDTTLVRIIFVLSGIGFFAYILLWAFVPSNSGTMIGGIRKKLYRDGDDKILAGVCSGIGNYFGINHWIPRALFLLPFLSFIFRWGHWGMMDFPHFLRIGFSPGALVIYIILWLVIPEAVTTAEKLEMKGEKVDMNSIRESVKEEMKGFQQRAEKFGKEAKTYAQEKGKVMGAEISGVAKRGGSSLGDIIVLMLRIFAYFIVGCVGFGLVMGLFGLGIAAFGLFPLKDFIINEGWQNAYAWGTLIFFIAVPVIGIITWIIRKLAKARGNSKMIRLSFISLWVIGWVSAILLVSSLGREFSHSNKMITEQELALSNPKINKLEITCANAFEKYNRNRWFRLEPFLGLEEDTAYIKNFYIRIVKSPSDSFRVTMIKMADGRTREIAERNAGLIQFGGVQQDSLLHLDRGIAINSTDKFRNQRVVLNVYVPVGKHVLVNRSVGWYNTVHFGLNNDGVSWDNDYNDEAQEWKSNVEYIMTADGHLITLNGTPAVANGFKRTGVNANTTSEDNYRYNNSQQLNKVDSLKEKMDADQQHMKDSLEKVKEKIEKQLEKLDENNNDEPGPLSAYKLQGYYPIMNIN